MGREAGEGGVWLDASDVHEKKEFVDDFGESGWNSWVGAADVAGSVCCSIPGVAAISGFTAIVEEVAIGSLGRTSDVGEGGCTFTST